MLLLGHFWHPCENINSTVIVLDFIVWHRCPYFCAHTLYFVQWNFLSSDCCHTITETGAITVLDLEFSCQDILNSLSGHCLWISGDTGFVTRQAHPLISVHCQRQTGLSINWHLVLHICHKQPQQAFTVQVQIFLKTYLWDQCNCCVSFFPMHSIWNNAYFIS